jgi:hypothetical protein
LPTDAVAQKATELRGELISDLENTEQTFTGLTEALNQE